MPLYNWSTTASSNDTADATINWVEGQAPSTVNNSARAMMAAVAQWRTDLGAGVTSGTATGYTLTTSENYSSLSVLNAKALTICPHVSCGTPVTLNVDGLGAKPLRPQQGVELTAGQLVAATPYMVAYNSADGAFYIYNGQQTTGGGVSATSVPIGALFPYTGSTAPNSNFALCYGQTISRTTYSTLASIYSGMSPAYPYGNGDGSTTFNLPDLRGRVPAGQDNMGGSAAGNIPVGLVTDVGTITGTTIGSTGGQAQHTMTPGELAPHAHTYFNAGAGSGSSPGGTAGGQTAGSVTGTNVQTSQIVILQPTIIIPYIIRII
jgi:microcystin-dependent protein